MASRMLFAESVPFEIWSKIFKLSLPQIQLESYRTYKRDAAPVTVSHVCATWRDVALATPQLWTQIYLRVGATMHLPHVKLISLFLDRSRSEPLSVDLFMLGHDMAVFPEVHECLLALFKSVVRWKTATLYFDFNIIDPNSWYPLIPTTQRAPLLEFLDSAVTPAEDDELSEEILPEMFWNNSPVLTKMAVSVYGIADERYAPDDRRGRYAPQSDQFSCWAVWNNIPFEQLTHLFLQAERVESISWEEAHTIFTDAPNLVSCFLVGVAGRAPVETEPVVLEHLRHLYLEAPDDSLEMLTGQLDCTLTAPSLVTLTFVNARLWDQRPYTRFITRSSCPLEELHYVSLWTPRQNFVECMRLSPSLKAVHVNDLNDLIDDEFVREMTEWDASTNRFYICPNLQRLSFPHFPYTNHDNKDVLRMEFLKKRLCPPNDSPKVFTTLEFPPTDFDPYGELCALRGEPWGVEIVSNEDAHASRVLWKRYEGN